MISWLILQPASSLSLALAAQHFTEKVFKLNKENFPAEIRLMWAARQ